MTLRQALPGLPGWRVIAGLTLGMGVAVAISWFLFFRDVDNFGLDPASLVRFPRWAIYAVQYLMVAVLLYAVTRRWLRGVTNASLAGAVTVAWVLQGAVLTVIGAPLVANELDPEIAWYYWLVATGGPLQPAAAFAGGWLALRVPSASRQDG